MRELAPAQIHLWQYAIGQPGNARHLNRAMSLLSDPEKTKCAAFHFDQHRAEYALSHAMLRLALSEYAPAKPERWQFSTGEWGKPEISNPVLDTPLWFNLSHADGLVTCVAGRIRQLGVDVENMNRTTSWDELAQRFFAPVEYEYLRSVPPPLQRDAFFRIWTLKEAYIKAKGKGLSIPLDSFHFHFAPQNPADVTLEVNGESDPGRWSFFEFQPGVDHRISVCAERTDGLALTVQRYEASLLLEGVLGAA
jgi:4'-phosphopantetheinyl transferase